MTPARLFWPGVLVGWAVMTVGFVGVVGEGRDVPVAAFARWLVGMAIVHDLVLVPAVLVAGAGMRRVVGRPWRAIATAAFVVSAPVVLFAWPFVAGWGRSASNPTIQPRDYTAGLAGVLAVIVAGVAVVAAIARRRAHRACPEPPAACP